MKSLGDDSHRIDVTRDEENRGKIYFRKTSVMHIVFEFKM